MTAIALASLLATTAPLLFNDGSGFKAGGGTVGLMKGRHPSIRMVDEKLHIVLPSGKVRVEYVFTNDGPATTALMAFPEQGYMLPPAENKRAKKGESLFGYFRTQVDGKPVSVKRMKGIQDPAAPDFSGYQHWWVKQVPFAAKQTRRVVNEYQGGLGWGPAWTPERSFYYTLHTGATWKGGKIGKLAVTIDARGLAGKAPINWSPDGWKHANGIWTLNRTNFEPVDDIGIRWPDGFYDFNVNGKEFPNSLYEIAPPPPMKVSPVKVGDDVWVPIDLVNPILGVQARLSGEKVHLSLGRSPATMASKILPGQGVPMVPLRQIVKAFGGESWWQSGRLYIRLL